jgi:hypothetical protein
MNKIKQQETHPRVAAFWIGRNPNNVFGLLHGIAQYELKRGAHP